MAENSTKDLPLVGTPAPDVKPILAPAPKPTEGWLEHPKLINCWVRTSKGKIVEVIPAADYTVTVLDSGVGEPAVGLAQGAPISR